MVEAQTSDQADASATTSLAFEVCLTLIAGYVDAAAFVHFGGLFVSFMSGNSTKLASLPSLGRGTDALMAAAAVVLFVMGAFAGKLVAEAAGAWRRPALLSITAALLAVATLAGGLAEGASGGALGVGLAIGGMTLAMGVMNTVLHKVGAAKVAATYVTGLLFHLGQALAERAMGRQSPWSVYVLSWLGLVLGAALGAVVSVHIGLTALVAPAGLAALLALVCGGLVRRAQARSPR